jgi:hypothetical protein
MNSLRIELTLTVVVADEVFEIGRANGESRLVVEISEVGRANGESGLVVDVADLLTARFPLFEVAEVVAFRAWFELAYWDEVVTVTVVVSQLVIATWHCCAKVVVFEKT